MMALIYLADVAAQSSACQGAEGDERAAVMLRCCSLGQHFPVLLLGWAGTGTGCQGSGGGSIPGDV